MSGPTLYLACNAEDYEVSTGECAHPYYSLPPSFIPYLSYEDGFLISGAIIGVWALGAVFRLFVRTADWSK